ncbi:hypothetical protein [Caproiciproducens galactitolivorans]|uniref:hypothetical protein n=1 Tax=Caproiciproducens galactitolivorans TaxID=642589 RepID=UPI00240A555B|nr:hypothetical protein [Caproiciproducens galactitolivorans]
MLRRNGSIDVLNNKRWNGSAWQDCEFIRRWNGSAWVDVWVGTHFGKAPFDIGTYTSTISNGTWNGYIPSDSSSYVETVSLILYPYTNYSVPLTLEIDCDCTVIGDGALYIGSFQENLGLADAATYNSFPRTTITKTVNTASAYLGISAQTNHRGGITCHVYGIKINRVSIPIR